MSGAVCVSSFGILICGTAFGLFVCQTELEGVFGCKLPLGIEAKLCCNEAGIGMVLELRLSNGGPELNFWAVLGVETVGGKIIEFTLLIASYCY